MQINKKTFLRSFQYLCLTFVFVVGIMAIVASGGGGDGGTTAATEDTTTDTTGVTTTDTTDGTTESLYDPTALPTGTSFEYTDDDSNPTTITFGSVNITGDKAGASASNDKIATITAPGTYNVTGTIADGQIIVDTLQEGDVRLVLQGVNITCLDGPPIDIENAERVIIRLKDGTDNYLTDAHTSEILDEDGEEIDAAIYSKEDLVICGPGTLTVDANYKDGIKSKDGLIIDSGTIIVNSMDDGIIGKNYISVEDGDITVNAWGDGLKSTNNGDITQGFIYVTDGFIEIHAGADAVQVETHIVIEGGTFELYTAGGSGNPVRDLTDVTAKGLKAPVGITIYDGIFTIDSADDSIHSNDTIVIHEGDYSLASGDDAIHGDLAVTINGGEINIPTSFEGIEGIVITINDGNIHLKSSDDAINASEGLGRMVMQFNCLLDINGGYIIVDGNGDGVDSNTAIEMNDGVLIVNGPAAGNNGNGPLDYSSFTMSGGFVIAAGSSGMAQAPGSQNSSQNSLLLNFTEAVTAGTLFHIETSNGSEIVTFAPTKNYQSIGFSSSALETGSTYNVYIGGSSTGTVTDGLYTGGTYTPGEQLTDYTFTIESSVTQMGQGGGMPGGGGRGGAPPVP